MSDSNRDWGSSRDESIRRRNVVARAYKYHEIRESGDGSWCFCSTGQTVLTAEDMRAIVGELDRKNQLKRDDEAEKNQLEMKLQSPYVGKAFRSRQEYSDILVLPDLIYLQTIDDYHVCFTHSADGGPLGGWCLPKGVFDEIYELVVPTDNYPFDEPGR